MFVVCCFFRRGLKRWRGGCLLLLFVVVVDEWLIIF